MQHKKCCYCEQKIPRAGHLKAVDHFRPKSIFRNLTNNWCNLLLACAQCNGKKSDRFPYELCNNNEEAKVIWIIKDNRKRALLVNGKCLIINPSELKSNPEGDLDYILDDNDDELGLIKNKTILGAFTIKVIGLSDSFHTKRRKDFYTKTLYKAYLNLIEARDLEDSSQMEVDKNTFAHLLHSSSQNAGFARAFARQKKLDIRFNIKIPT